MGIRDDIAELRARIGTQLLPAYVSELQAFERALLAGGCGLNERWHELRQGLGLEISAAMSRLALVEKALALVEKALAVVEKAEQQDEERARIHAASLEFGHDYQGADTPWRQRQPTGKEAAANDR